MHYLHAAMVDPTLQDRVARLEAELTRECEEAAASRLLIRDLMASAEEAKREREALQRDHAAHLRDLEEKRLDCARYHAEDTLRLRNKYNDAETARLQLVDAVKAYEREVSRLQEMANVDGNTINVLREENLSLREARDAASENISSLQARVDQLSRELPSSSRGTVQDYLRSQAFRQVVADGCAKSFGIFYRTLPLPPPVTAEELREVCRSFLTRVFPTAVIPGILFPPESEEDDEAAEDDDDPADG